MHSQTHRGLEGRALAGFHTGGTAYGYTTVEEPSPAGPRKPRRLPVIDAAKSVVVLRAFGEFVSGKDPREISHGLNADQIPAPHDGGGGVTEALTNNPTSKRSGSGWRPKRAPSTNWRPSYRRRRLPGRRSSRSAIAKYFANLADLLESGDLVRAGEVRSALAPFRMLPQEGGGYRMAGALNVGLTDKVVAGA